MSVSIQCISIQSEYESYLREFLLRRVVAVREDEEVDDSLNDA